MSSIHYFQRYSQKENVVTNNTLLLLARLYETSTLKFQKLLNEILEVDVEVGLNFLQQTKTSDSIPDGTIFQKSFKIVIETKLGDDYRLNQLQNHLAAFQDEEYQFLLALGSKELKPNNTKSLEDYVVQYNKTNQKRVNFISTTFSKIIEAFENVLTDYDFELENLIADYRGFCHSSGLIPNDDYLMRLVLCSSSLEDNFKYNLYYDVKGFREHKYVGIYSNKAIRGIGKIENIIQAELDNDALSILSSTSAVTENQKERILASMKSAIEKRGWDISKNHNFFCVEEFVKTKFEKASKGAPMGTKFFDLRTVLNVSELPNTTEDIALALTKETWK